jgi:hypothetical protein
MFQVRLGACIGAGMNPAFQVAIQILVGIQFRGVGREIEDRYLIRARRSKSSDKVQG